MPFPALIKKIQIPGYYTLSVRVLQDFGRLLYFEDQLHYNVYIPFGGRKACCSDSEKALFRGEKPEKIKKKRRFLWIYLKHYVKPRDRKMFL